ncbi:MAG: NAD(P)/FAD-dependent oxidoreductase [Acidobacteriota bacterium]|nr:NAD(P)/FAD-dependent oxidoreductase [Acidobacteriota bacterium]
MSTRIAIVGSGFLGLTMALRLDPLKYDVTLFEAADQIGGLASAWQIGNVTWDKHYHVTLLSDLNTRKIVEDIGLGDEFEWVETKTGFYTGGRLYSMSDTMEFLRFPPLDLMSKLRLGATIFYASRVKDWKRLETIPVDEWLAGLSGKKTFEKIWKPLLMAKLGEAYKETSAAFIWATIQRMYAARKSGLKKEMFGYVSGGYASVLERFAAVLEEKGVGIKLLRPVESVRREGARVLVESKGESDEFDKVIVTCSPSAASRMIPQLTKDEHAALERVKYQGIVCASVLMKKPLSEFYVTNVTDESPFTGIIEMSAMVDKDEFGGRNLVYLPKYVAPDDPLFQKPDEEIEDRFLSALEAMYPKFSRADVVAFRVSRVKEVFPVPVLDYSASVPSKITSVDGVFTVNSAQITNGTLNVNETIQLALEFLDEFSAAETREGSVGEE